jgi:PAS domain S-box-containing protein
MIVLGLVLAWALLVSHSSALALDPSLDVSQYAHTSWTIRDGYLKGTVRSIVQTTDGYLWLGTEFGLVRFDGVRFVPWTPPPGQPLPSSNIRSLFAARDGTLWIGTLEGLASWKDGKLTQYAEFAGQNVLALLEDREGTVWAGTFGIPKAKLCAVRGGAVNCYGDDGSLGQWVWSLYEDGDGGLWAGAESGLWLWRPGPPKRYPLPHPIETAQALAQGDTQSALLAAADGIWQMAQEKIEHYRAPIPPGPFSPVAMLRDHNGGLWVGTVERGLLHIYQGKTTVFAQSDGLSGDHVVSLFEDREGNIWAGTADGLDRFHDVAVSSISVKQGLSSPSVMSVLAARDGSVWLGTLDGLSRWNNGDVTIYRARAGQDTESSPPLATRQPIAYLERGPEGVTELTDPELPDNQIGSFFEDDRGRIWVSTRPGLARFEGGKFHALRDAPAGWVNAITAEPTVAGVWVSYQDQGLVRLVDDKVVEQIPWSKLGGEVVASTVVPDSVRGGLWLGFFQGGLVHLTDGQVSESYGKSEGLGGGRIMGLQLDGDGSLWAATEGGLSRVKDGRVATLTTANGLPCETVHWVIETGGDFWLYTPCGLLRIPRSELEAWASEPTRTISFTRFDNSDGVRSHALLYGYTPRVSKSPDGRLWFANFESVGVVDPLRLAVNTVIPPVHIEQVIADGKPYDTTPGLRLPPLVHDLTIDYTALSFVAPEKMRFRYMLEGQDKNWREVVNDRRVQYSNLGPGHYRFRVTACNNIGVWNEEGALLDFSIEPAFYQTTWFRVLCGAIFLALLFAAYRLRVRRLRQQERKFRETLEAIPAMTFVAQPDGSRMFFNRRWVDYTGLSIEQASGFGWQAAVHPDDLERVLDKLEVSLKTGEPLEYELRIRRAADGQYRWFLTRAVALRDRGGKIVKWCGVTTDIEDRKRAERERERLHQMELELAHINRVSLLGELTSSIAHEINQPLTGAITSAGAALRWLTRDQPDLEKARTTVTRIKQDGERAARIITRLRSFYRKGTPQQREPVDINEAVGEMLVLLRYEADRRSVALRTELTAGLPAVRADRVQMQQVLMNLMLNGIEAVGEAGGELTVRTRVEGGRVLVSVSDTGAGLPPDEADRIFDSFYTTKPEGTGLGLAISRSIVESHGGRLWATNNEGRGATFHFTLPIQDEAHQ